MSTEIQHEIVTDATGVVHVDGVEEDIAAAIDRFSAEAALTGSPVLFRTSDAGADPVCFQVDAQGLVALVNEESETESVSPGEDPAQSETSVPVEVTTIPAAENGDDEPTVAKEQDPFEHVFVSRSSTDAAVNPPRSRIPFSSRWLLVGGAVTACVIAAVGIWGATTSVGAPSTPKPVAAPTTAAPVTLPGWSGTSAWSVKGVDAAAAFGRHVIGLSGDKVTVWEASSGREVSTVTLAGEEGKVLAGDVDSFAALAAVSNTQALVWVDGQTTPLTIDLTGGRTLQARTGTFFVAGPDRTFWLVTKEGEVPVTAPSPQMIVLGGGPEQIFWATGAGHVITASPNGTILADAALAAPAEGATVTPKTGWLRAAAPNVTVVGWTLPDGQVVTGIHNTATGALLGTVPGPGTGLLQPGRGEWVTDGVRISLVDGTTSPLPAGFVPQTYLGGDLLGAITGGGDAILGAGKSDPTRVTGSTVRPVAVADMPPVMISLTGGRLAAYPAATPKK